MGRGDRKTRKGKIFRASFGNSRMKAKKLAKNKVPARPATAAPKKKAPAKKK